MSENEENVCEICSQEISEDNRASSSTSEGQRAICNECFGNLHGESSKVKLEEVPINLIEFNTDIPKIVEVPYESDYFYCYHCGYATTDKAKLVEHVIVHRGVKNDDTKVLEMVELNKDNLKIIQSPRKINFLHCYHCSYFTVKKSMLIKHLKKHRGNSAKKISFKSGFGSSHFQKQGIKSYKCNICDYSDKQLGYLIKHMRMHYDEKPYKCKVCDYSSKDSRSLTYHMRTHTDEKPYKCKLCDYSSTQTGNLTIHMRTHTGEKSYKCKLYDYSSKNSGSLTCHMRTHTGEKPYKCKVCDYSSKDSSGRTKHMRTHTVEKPYKCKLCDFSSKDPSSLTYHMRTHTGETPYKCKVYEFSSSQADELEKYILLHISQKH